MRTAAMPSPGDVHNLVVRIPPATARALFPQSDLVTRAEVQTLLVGPAFRSPPWSASKSDPSVLGRPFLVTRRVDGRLVDSSDPYLSTGWLHDGSEKLPDAPRRRAFSASSQTSTVST